MIFSALKRSAMVCLALTLALPLLAQQAQPIAGGNPALPLVHVENGDELCCGAEGALRCAGFARWISLGLREAR